MNRSYSKIRHIQESNQRLENRLLNEQEHKFPMDGKPHPVGPGMPPPTPQQSTTNQEQTKTITNKVASEGLKNVTTQIVDGPPFKGMYSGYEFGGVFNGIDYEWNCNGVEGMLGVRGMVDGQIISGNNSQFQKPLDGKITDAIPNGVWVGFYGNDKHGFILYVTTSNKPKVANF